jgi:hypothetical protein
LQSAVAGPECGEVVLEWPAAVESCNGPVIYDVHRSPNPLFVPGPGSRIGTTMSTGFVDTSLTPGIEHTYIVRARDGVGNAETNNVRLHVVPTQFDLLLMETGFEANDESWSVVPPNDASAGNWEWGDPVGTPYQPENDATEGGVNCWITELGYPTGNGDVDDGTTTLLSAPYDMSGASVPKVAYSRWFTNDRGGSPGDSTDTFLVEVSDDDGQSWSVLEEVGAGTPLAWVPVDYSLPVAPTPEIRFRFTARDLGSGSLVEAGIDEFRLIDEGQRCNQCDPVPQTLCSISIEKNRDDVVVDWSVNPVDTRAVVYHVTGCDAADRVKLGTTEESSFVHEDALLSHEPFQYRVTFVDACGNEQGFCGPTDCP